MTNQQRESFQGQVVFILHLLEVPLVLPTSLLFRTPTGIVNLFSRTDLDQDGAQF